MISSSRGPREGQGRSVVGESMEIKDYGRRGSVTGPGPGGPRTRTVAGEGNQDGRRGRERSGEGESGQSS